MKALALTARRPGAEVIRPYHNLPLPADGPSSVVPGVEWKSFIDATAGWQWVPEFRDLAATASGTISVPSVSVRPADDHFSLLFAGYIQIPTAGSYNFYLNSDTGADFFLHDGHLIADDVNHSGSASAPAVNLSAGRERRQRHHQHRARPSLSPEKSPTPRPLDSPAAPPSPTPSPMAPPPTRPRSP